MRKSERGGGKNNTIREGITGSLTEERAHRHTQSVTNPKWGMNNSSGSPKRTRDDPERRITQSRYRIPSDELP